MVVPLGSAMAVPHGSAMAEHVLRKIHDCTFRPKYFLRDFLHPKSPDHRPQIIVFSYFFPTFHDKTPYFSQTFSISSLKNSDRFFSHQQEIGLFLLLFHQSTPHPLFITAETAFRHWTFSFITAHFVHHLVLSTL